MHRPLPGDAWRRPYTPRATHGVAPTRLSVEAVDIIQFLGSLCRAAPGFLRLGITAPGGFCLVVIVGSGCSSAAFQRGQILLFGIAERSVAVMFWLNKALLSWSRLGRTCFGGIRLYLSPGFHVQADGRLELPFARLLLH